MNLEFKNENKETASLGSISFDALDKLNIFDQDNEVDDYFGEIIFKVSTKEKCEKLANDIEKLDLTNKLNEWQVNKVKNLISLLKKSNSIIAIIR